MRILRERLVTHLQRVSCGGLIKEAIFKGAFAADALTPDHLLLVVAPDLEDVEALESEIGVGDLKKFISALGFIGGDGDEQADVDVSVQNHRLVIDESARNARVQLVTANPKTIATRVEEATVDKLLEKIEGAEAGTVALSVSLLDDVKKVFDGLKADTVQLVTGPNGGFIRVGGQNTDGAEFFSPALVSEQPVTLNFGEHLIKVFAIVSGDVVLKLPGAGSSTIAIEDEGFTYLLSAKAQAAAGKPAVKGGEAPAAQTPTGEGEAPAAEKPKRSRRKTAAAAS